VTEFSNQRAEAGASMLRLRTLVRLRWLAVIGQTVTVILVALYLGYPMPLGFCLGLIAFSAWLNIFLSIRWRGSQRLRPRMAGLLLAYDTAQLAGLLYLTGGLENPFAFLFLVPVTVSATSLPLRSTLALGALTFGCATALAFYHLPLPWPANSSLQLPKAYVLGLWIAIACGTVFSAIYARRIAEEARQMSAALGATEMVLAREQRLSALDGLAAAAAPELGTPLGTIAVVTREMERELPAGSPLADDVALLRSQSERCRDILRKLSSMGADPDAYYVRLSVSALIDEVIEPFRDMGLRLAVKCAGNGPEPVGRRNAAILYGLGNIVENAVDFAESEVSIFAT